jgi:predicted peptidase
VSRIYLTGLSMGGRGTFIVAAQEPDIFAALMPLSPHHGPFNYLPLAEKIKDIPIWMSHGDIDQISSYDLAKKMADTLHSYGANIKFRTEQNVGHWGWDAIYSDSSAVNWLLSWTKL